ncbi:Cytochrome P450 [Macrophomina phaseolina MS6]|uniref:Cytochrome P450 n=1 Tax=Macrophomina phaseolina (strain MS6) TaxID=1126212 RepID=K2RZ37_MACPH|nr:Cytochrome P450 [Macrophomina phaseolina MS6]
MRFFNFVRYRHNEISTLHKAHRRHGPVVLIGPADISINCVKGGLKTVYLGGFGKPEWFANVFVNFGTLNMVSMEDHHSHSVRKRILSHLYSKSHILSSSALKGVMQTVVQDRFIPVLHSAAEASADVDVYSLFGGAAMDIVTGYLYGLYASTDFTTNEAERRRFHDLYFSRRGPDFWLQFPTIVSFLKKYLCIGLVPAWFTTVTEEIEAFILAMNDKAGALLSESDPTIPALPSHQPTVYAHLSSTLHASAASAPSPSFCPRLATASELMDHTIAGYEASTITLTYLSWQLSLRPSLQRALRAEILAAAATTPDESFLLPDPRTLDTLPLLHACVIETLRLHAGAPGPQPRVTPHVVGGTTLGPPGTPHCYAGIPGGVRVAASAWCLHRNEEVFPEAEEWRPERWLDGKGGLLKVGRAEGPGAEIKHVAAALYAGFETEVVDDEGIEQEDHFLAHPKGHKLIVRVKEIDLGK